MSDYGLLLVCNDLETQVLASHQLIFLFDIQADIEIIFTNISSAYQFVNTRLSWTVKTHITISLQSKENTSGEYQSCLSETLIVHLLFDLQIWSTVFTEKSEKIIPLYLKILRHKLLAAPETESFSLSFFFVYFFTFSSAFSNFSSNSSFFSSSAFSSLVLFLSSFAFASFSFLTTDLYL